MDTGIYIALSKETGIFRDMEVTANNLANMTTTGYQAESLLFSDFLTHTTGPENNVSFANDYTTYRSGEQGTMQTTGSALDAAIEGKGFFVVQTPLGIRYTRNGNFKTNGSGVMVTSEGYPVMDSNNQPIIFDDNDRVVQIREDGTINVDDSERGTLKIVQFDNEQLLQRTGNTMYKSNLPAKNAQDFRVLNGVLERSNVQSVTTLTHLMYVSRSATDTANFINTMYTLERKASDTLSKVYS